MCVYVMYTCIFIYVCVFFKGNVDEEFILVIGRKDLFSINFEFVKVSLFRIRRLGGVLFFES